MGNWWRWLGGKVARTTFPRTTIRGGLNQSARLHVEELENRCVPARFGTPLNDPDDTIAEAINVGTITNKRSVRRSASLGFATDVDMYRFSVAAGATVEFIVQARAPATDPYLRLFDRRGNELAFNDDGPIPNQPPGFSPYLKYQFSTAGTYYIGISGYPNMNYDPIQGTGDVEGSTGPYSLIIKLVPPEGGGGGGGGGGVEAAGVEAAVAVGRPPVSSISLCDAGVVSPIRNGRFSSRPPNAGSKSSSAMCRMPFTRASRSTTSLLTPVPCP
jgi:hypothetical protein